jgi:two-component system cell cycle sensor histidine kinase/response regulator CckA
VNPDTIARLSPLPIVISRFDDGRLLWVNDAFAHMMGQTHDALTKRSAHELYLDESEHSRLLESLSEQGEVTGFEVTLQRQDGGHVQLLWSARVIEDFEGAKAIIASAADIGARRQAELSMRQNAEQLQALATLAPFPVGVSRLSDAKLVYLNRAFAEFLQASPEELLGKRAPDFYADPTARNRMLALLQEHGELRDYQIRARRPDGSERLALVSLQILTFDGEPSIMASVADITDWQNAEAALGEERLRLAGMLDIAGEAIISIDSDGHIVLFNRGAEEVFGYSADEALGQSLDILLPESQHRIHHEYIGAFAAGDTATRRMGLRPDVAGRRKNGEEFPAGVSISKLIIGDQLVLTAIIRDLSASRAAEEAIERSRAQLRHAQKMEALGRLAGGIAHDFNNLLVVILGGCSLVRAELPSGSACLTDIDDMEGAAERAADLTRQLLALGRKQILQRSVLDLHDVASKLQQLLRRTIGENIDLRLVPSPTPVLIEGDAGQLEQVVMNLIINAADAVDRRGTITVKIDGRALHEPMTTSRGVIEPGAWAILSVNDDGHGMDDDTMSRIFEPFFTTKGPGIGTGLGLSSALGIIEQLGGAIDVASVIGQGSSFHVWLPALEGSVAATEPRAERSPTVQGGSELILLAEDDPHVRKLTKRMLRELGYDVREAANAEEALRLCRGLASPPDLLLTDVVMPGIDGRQLAKMITAQRPNTKVLFMTGHAADLLVDGAFLDDGIELLRKPFQRKELAARVRATLAG